MRTVKERGRSTCHYIPYRKYKKLTTNSLAEGAIYWLNTFPSNNIFSNTIGPAVIFLGRNQPYFNIKRIEFVEYAISYTNTKYDITSRGLISISPRQPKYQGGHYFMSLFTGKRINAYHWEELPINNKVIINFSWRYANIWVDMS